MVSPRKERMVMSFMVKMKNAQGWSSFGSDYNNAGTQNVP
jgi:hypothetical protein